MPAVFSANNFSVQVAPADLIQSALLESGILQAGENISAEDGQWGLEKLQRLVDSFNARREIIFRHDFTQFTLKANHGPHTIGPGGDFQLPARPVRIVSASFVLSSGAANPVDLPINAHRDADWWAANPLKSMLSTVVTDLYYDPQIPLGNLNFWPICTIANPVRLETWDALTQAVDLVTPLGFAPGYWDGIVLTLAINLWPSYNRMIPVPADLKEQQRMAMKVIYQNNDPPPRIITNRGMPSSRVGRPDFNFLTGLRE